MSEPLPSGFDEWEAEMFRHPDASANDADCIKQSVMAEKKALEYDIEFVTLQARRLGMLTAPQFHRLPFAEGRLEVLATTWPRRPSKSEEPEYLHITQNIRGNRLDFPVTVQVKDFGVGLQNKTIGLRKESVTLGAVDSLTLSPVPVIWPTKDRVMRRYVRKNYTIPGPDAIPQSDLLAYYQKQRNVAAQLEGLLRRLSPEVSLEQEIVE